MLRTTRCTAGKATASWARTSVKPAAAPVQPLADCFEKAAPAHRRQAYRDQARRITRAAIHTPTNTVSSRWRDRTWVVAARVYTGKFWVAA